MNFQSIRQRMDSTHLTPFSEEEREQILKTIKVLKTIFRNKVPNPHMLARMPEYRKAYYALFTLHNFFTNLQDPRKDYLKGEEERFEQIHRLNECIERLAACNARLDEYNARLGVSSEQLDVCNERLDKCGEKLDELNG